MLIDYKNVQICLDSKEILSNVNFEVNENDFVYLVGKVGAGKSSLLKTLYGELPIENGEAHILGYNLTKLKRKRLPELRQQLGIVFQDFQLIREQTVGSNLDFVLRSTGWKKKHRPERINEVLSLVGLTGCENKFPHELSGGEQQRICIARALLNHPKIILADEPTGNLDIETSRNIMKILMSVREQGTAVVMITHNLNLLSNYPGIVYECSDGTIHDATAEYNRSIELFTE